MTDELRERAEKAAALKYRGTTVSQYTIDHYTKGYLDGAESRDEEIAELKETLEFYADHEHWTIDWLEGSYGDYGKRARKVLEKYK